MKKHDGFVSVEQEKKTRKISLIFSVKSTKRSEVSSLESYYINAQSPMAGEGKTVSVKN